MKSLLADPQIHQALVNAAIAIASLIGALVGVAIRVGTQMLSAKMHNEHNVLYAAVADRLVKYAEQQLPKDANDQKAGYVIAQLKAKFPELAPMDAQHLVEQAVVNMQIAMAAPQITSVAPAAGDVKQGG